MMKCAPSRLWAPDAPLIVFTDIGDDVDDAAALRLVAADPRLRLVATVDELPWFPRARLARYLMDLCGRTDVQVVPGAVLGDSPYWCADGLVPPEVQVPGADLYAAVAAVCGRGPGPVRVLSLGPLTDIAQLLITDMQQPAPLGFARRFRIVAMAGGLDGYDPHRSEHNVRQNPAALHTVVGAEHLALVLADHTGVPALAITEDSPLYRRLAASPQPWAQLLAAHYRQYWQAYKRPSCLHDAAAASLPLGHDFVRGADRVFRLERDGRMRAGTGTRAWLSTGIDHPRFMAWTGRAMFDGRALPSVPN